MSDCDNYDYEDDEEYSYVDEDDDDSGTDDEDDFEQIIHELKENDVISLPTSVATSTVVLPSVELLVASTKHPGNQHFRATVQELEGVDARTLVDSYAGRFVVPVASNTGDDASSSGWTRVSDREALSFVQSVINNIRTEEEAEASVPTEQDTTMLPPTEIETTNRFVSSNNNEEEGTTTPSTEANTLLDGNGAVGGGGESMHDWDDESLATTMTEDYNFVPTTQHYGDTNHDITDDAGSWDVVSQISEFDLSSIASFQTAGMATTASSYVMPGGSVAGSENDASSLYSSRMSVALSTYSFVDGKVPCKRCTYLNDEGTLLCTVCNLALGANPSLDIDAQIALQIQRRDEEEASMQVVRNTQQESFLGDSSLPAATAPKPTRPIWEQAQDLIADIEAFLGENLLPDAIYRPLPMYDLQFLAAAWINWRETNQRLQLHGAGAMGAKINRSELNLTNWSTWIGFHSTTKTEAEVAKDGFGPGPQVLPDLPKHDMDGHDIWLCAVTLGMASKDYRTTTRFEDCPDDVKKITLVSSNQCLPLLRIRLGTKHVGQVKDPPLSQNVMRPFSEMTPALSWPSGTRTLKVEGVLETAMKMKNSIFRSTAAPDISLWTAVLTILESRRKFLAAIEEYGDANTIQLTNGVELNAFGEIMNPHTADTAQQRLMQRFPTQIRRAKYFVDCFTCLLANDIFNLRYAPASAEKEREFQRLPADALLRLVSGWLYWSELNSHEWGTDDNNETQETEGLSETNVFHQMCFTWQTLSNTAFCKKSVWLPLIGFTATTRTEDEIAKRGFGGFVDIFPQPPKKNSRGHEDIWICAATLGVLYCDCFNASGEVLDGGIQSIRLRTSNQCLPLLKLHPSISRHSTAQSLAVEMRNFMNFIQVSGDQKSLSNEAESQPFPDAPRLARTHSATASSRKATEGKLQRDRLIADPSFPTIAEEGAIPNE